MLFITLPMTGYSLFWNIFLFYINHSLITAGIWDDQRRSVTSPQITCILHMFRDWSCKKNARINIKSFIGINVWRDVPSVIYDLLQLSIERSYVYMIPVKLVWFYSYSFSKGNMISSRNEQEWGTVASV